MEQLFKSIPKADEMNCFSNIINLLINKHFGISIWELVRSSYVINKKNDLSLMNGILTFLINYHKIFNRVNFLCGQLGMDTTNNLKPF